MAAIRISSFIFILTLLAPLAARADVSRAFGPFEIGTTGYFRAGGGVPLGGADTDRRTCFQAPGAGAKYRLGNECETYGEAFGFATYRPDGKDGPSVLVKGGPSYVGDDGEMPEYNQFAQAFVEIGTGKALMNDVKFWVGRRFYDRHDVHMNDFFWLNMSDAHGGGMRDMDLGMGKLDFAVLGKHQRVDMNNDGDTLDAADAETRQMNHDLRWHDIPANKDGKVMLWLNYATAPDVNTGAGSYRPGNGASAGVVHKQDSFFGGFNTIGLQYGKGLGRNLGTNGLSAVQANASNIDEAHIFRLVENALVVPNEDWSAMGTFIWEERDASGFDGSEQTWLSAGLRPYRNITDRVRVGAEVSADYVNNKAAGGTDGVLMKYTLDVELAPERGFFSRPSLRAYVTHADWSDSWRGLVGGPSYASRTRGSNIGVQLEYWW